MLRKTIAVIPGVLGGMFVIFLIESLGHLLIPLPEGINSANKESLEEFIQQAPLKYFLPIIVAYALGGFVAGMLPTIIQKRKSKRQGIIAGLLLMHAAIFNLFMIPHPLWFWIVGIGVFMPMTYMGARLAYKPAIKNS